MLDIRIKTCPVCKTEFKGRLNQKYCSIKCKSEYNNDLRRSKLKPLKKHMAILNTNREVLQNLLQKGIEEVSREQLNAMGYNLAYFTHAGKTKISDKTYFVFDYGLAVVNNKFKVFSDGSN